MALCLVAYPSLKTADRDWIQSIRRQSDPQFSFIDPHVTLVFPTDAVPATEMEQQAQRSAWSVVQFGIVLRCALPVADPIHAQHRLFLVPDEGLSTLVRLHDRLYSGPIAAALRLDRPYIPHITVGAFDDALTCKHAADRINQDRFAIEGWIETLTLLQVENDSLQTLAEIELPPVQRGSMAIL